MKKKDNNGIKTALHCIYRDHLEFYYHDIQVTNIFKVLGVNYWYIHI